MRQDERKKASMTTEDSITASCGNVFADLGLKNPAEHLAKAELVQRIADIIAEQKLTQAKAAKVLGIDQPKVSALLRGKLDGFSLDRLFRFLARFSIGLHTGNMLNSLG
jgi:predicted XRE-type DNA-binding protein